MPISSRPSGPPPRNADLAGRSPYSERFEKQGANPMTGQQVTVERRRVKVDENIPMGVEYDDFIRRVMDGQ